MILLDSAEPSMGTFRMTSCEFYLFSPADPSLFLSPGICVLLTVITSSLTLL